MSMSENDQKFWATEIKLLLNHLVGRPLFCNFDLTNHTELSKVLHLIKAAFAVERDQVDKLITDEAKKWALSAKGLTKDDECEAEVGGAVKALQDLQKKLKKRD